MPKYGLKIKNYEAASIYGMNYGIRNKFDSTDAMLTNSLFLDFLLENGLALWKDKSTRDVVCLAFSYGSPDLTKEIAKCESFISSIQDDAEINSDEKAEKIIYYQNLIDCYRNCDSNYKQLNRQELREYYYVNGVDISYPIYSRGERQNEVETIHYRMLYRTPGKAKKGTCMFIREELYETAHNFLYMGIQLPETNAPIVEMGAYSSLITSSIIDRIQIKPEQILIMKDVEAFTATDVITINTDEERKCYAKRESDYHIINTMFDGQALIDESIFPNDCDGYVLLRHHMTKCAAFCTRIQLFMREHYGDKYETATITDMFGREVLVKNIRLITTENAIKWTKFGVSFDYWADWLRKNNCMFGVVKTSHKSKLGDVQRMSYQMMNALNFDSMNAVVSKSVEYINQLKNDEVIFQDYLRKNINFSNDFDVILALVEQCPNFIYSEYYRERKRKIIQAYILNFKSGRCIQNADNLTIVGSPYAMLMHSVGEDPLSDPTFEIEDGTMQCYTARFNNGEYLAEFRNPFNSRSNLGYLHNHYHEYFDKYFNLGNLCIAINMNGTMFQDRNNGSDQDSDSIYVTNQSEIVAHAKYCYDNYPTIVNKIPKTKNKYSPDMLSFAKVDNELAAAQLAIGESSNLAQLCLSYTYNFDDQKYADYVAILSVLAQVAIDNAKRHFDIDITKEIARIKSDMNIAENGYPYFWQITKKDKRKARNDQERRERQRANREKIQKQINKNLICPMNYLYNLKFDNARPIDKKIDMDKFIVIHKAKNIASYSRKIQDMIVRYSIMLVNENKKNDDNELEQYLLERADFEDMIAEIRINSIPQKDAEIYSWLLNRAFLITPGVKGKRDTMNVSIRKNKPLLMKALYSASPKTFLKCFRNNKENSTLDNITENWGCIDGL